MLGFGDYYPVQKMGTEALHFSAVDERLTAILYIVILCHHRNYSYI
jgi:hypothetical protein